MAKNNDNPSKGDVNFEYGVARSGLDMDNSLSQVEKGKLTYALNATLENYDSNSINYQNELGNEYCLSFPNGYVLIGKYHISEQNKHIFWLANPDTGGSEIGYMDNNDCVYRTLVNASCLAFDIHYPIKKAVHKINNCTTQIYWTDGLNPRRYLDLNDIPYKLGPTSDLCTPTYTNELDCNQINVQPNFSVPQLEVVDIINGGSILSGIVQFTVQYADAAGNPLTSYYSITNPTPIADLFLPSNDFNNPVGKSVVVDVSNLDLTGQFQYFNLAVITIVNNITTPYLVGTYFIDSVSQQVTYTGQNESQIQLSILDITEKFSYYDIAQDLTTSNDILIWDNLTSIDRINYQNIATGINVLWETVRIPSTKDYSDELLATNYRGYTRDEIYPLEAVFLLANGKETDGFHIPGRAISSTESSLPLIPITNPDFVGNPTTTLGGVPASPYWMIYNTATVLGTSPLYTTDKKYEGPYQYGEFAYWESTEEYPCNNGLWGSLAGQKIRHHKFPDVLVSPITESLQFTSSSTMVMEDNAIYPIGIRVDPEQVLSLINSSDLTDNQKAEIVGFKIVRGDRGTNKSVIAKGILRNVNSYTRVNGDIDGENKYYYANYPYNDLREDPFLLQSNNAYGQECVSYKINIGFLNTSPPDGSPAYTELQYVSCDTAKALRIKYFATGEQFICSLILPTVIGSTVSGPFEITVAPPNYDVYRLSTTSTSFPFFPPYAGWHAEYIDPRGEIQTIWVPGFGEGTNSVKVVVKAGTVVACTGTTCNPEKKQERKLIEQVRGADNCANPLPQHGVPEENKYLQIFSSPETSFGQPFLGNVLKLENVMFGAGKGHFTLVKDNARYKLLSLEAQKAAFAAASEIADNTDPFNPIALFTAYDAMLQIYVNSIVNGNFAYSYNSIAGYNYHVDILNNGVKQRPIEVTQYLIPAVTSIADLTINNYQRESAVFIQTADENEGVPVSSLPFPSDSPGMLPTSVVDKSRFTASEVGNCDNPEKIVNLSVVSYYASMKNIFVNQWGQIYSYKTIDTGYQHIFNSATNPDPIVFGGDTFITKFAYKSKLPFFLDNRVNAPDYSDIFYDEIGNVAFPKYWHSARSITSDASSEGIVLPNFFSYKAHNFDCPNYTNEIGFNDGLKYYEGYFYLFAYGIPSFYCESSYNTDLRQAFNNKEGDFWPHVTTNIPDDWVQESWVSIAWDNTYTYNVTYSKQNTVEGFTHLPPDWDSSFCYTHYPFRAIYSDPQFTNADNKVNNWLIYRPVSYFDFPQNYGNLVSLDGIQNRAILARFENKTTMYDKLLTIDTSNPQAAYIGNSRLFSESPPIDFAVTDLGYVGCQNKMLLKTPYGQITTDAKRGNIFLIQGTEAKEISGFGSGVHKFLADHLAFEILKYFPTTYANIDGEMITIPGVDTDNNFTGIGLHGVYDSKNNRVVITKLDYVPLYTNIIYDHVTRDFFIVEEGESGEEIRTQVYLKDSDYFCNKSWSLSYNMNTQTWVSFHSYLPNYYIAENNFFYSGMNTCCEGFDFIAVELQSSPSTSTTTTVRPSTTTTTSTTAAPLDCEFTGYIIEVDCTLEGMGEVTVEPIPPAPMRPSPVYTNYLLIGYYIPSTMTYVYTTGSLLDAQNGAQAMRDAVVDGEFIDFIPLYQAVQTLTYILTIGETVYLGITTDTNVIPAGWYSTEEAVFLTYNVYEVDPSGILVNIINNSPTTTTTTTL